MNGDPEGSSAGTAPPTADARRPPVPPPRPPTHEAGHPEPAESSTTATPHDGSGQRSWHVPTWAEPRVTATRRWFPDSLIGQVWRRLQSLDFMNRGTLLAAVLLLCFIPFMIVARSIAGRSAATGLTTRFGLDRQAADAVGQVFLSPKATSSAISGFSWVFLVLGGIAAAAAIQQLYESAFDLKPRGLRDTPRQAAWLALVVVASGLAGWAGPTLHSFAGPVLLGVVGLVWFTALWWLGMWVLLGGRMGWSRLFPSALATAILWLGTTVAFRLTLSATITTDYRKYGAIGVIFGVMSVLIAIGVVILLGAVVGLVWQERRATRTAAGTKVPEESR